MHTAGHAADAAAAEAAVEAAEKRARRKERTAPRIRQLAGFLVALVFILGILVAWGYAQNIQHPRWALRAELLFLGLVLWWGLVALSPWLSRLSRRIDDTVEVAPISNVQGLVWSAGILIGVPLAIAQWPWGTAIAIAVAVGSAPGIVLARRRWERLPNAPLCFSCVAGTVILLPLAYWTDLEKSNDPKLADAPPGLVGDAHAAVLARDLRPFLFLDDRELFDPVDVARVVCSKPGGTGCDVERMNEFTENVAANAALPPERRSADAPSAIFHHVFKDGKRVYVDYWWYFAHNPTPVARDLVCGRALTRGWLGKGCAEHAADWEGITIVLRHGCSATAGANSCIRRDGATYEIHEVHYAQHEKVVVYPWKQLKRKWRRARNYTGVRPLVFVALHSHASYAMPCADHCSQLVHWGLTERRNGRRPWVHNQKCRNCVVAIPTNEHGEPIRWAEDKQRWGEMPNCILFGTYCDGQRPPLGPAYQARYKDPCPDEPGAHHCLSLPEKYGRYLY